jgi:hypothetical protein
LARSSGCKRGARTLIGLRCAALAAPVRACNPAMSSAAKLGGRGPTVRIALAITLSLGAGVALLHMSPSGGSDALGRRGGAGADIAVEDAAAAAVLGGGAGAGVVDVRRKDGPAQEVCHTHLHADYAGDMAVVWGMNFRVDSAAACCEACAAHARVCGAADGHGKDFFPGQPHPCGDKPENTCNMWVYCAGGGADVDNRCAGCASHMRRAAPTHVLLLHLPRLPPGVSHSTSTTTRKASAG